MRVAPHAGFRAPHTTPTSGHPVDTIAGPPRYPEVRPCSRPTLPPGERDEDDRTAFSCAVAAEDPHRLHFPRFSILTSADGSTISQRGELVGFASDYDPYYRHRTEEQHYAGYPLLL